MATFDLVVVGAGIVGLAHALAATRRGLRVAVVERDAHACEAAVRNFGFVTITGQSEDGRARALRSRETWEQVSAAAGIPILQRGAAIVAQREEANAVLAEFAAGPMGEGCALWDPARVRREMPMLAATPAGALWSPHEIRIEAREAIPRLAAWLQSSGVTFHWGSAAFGFDGSRLHHARGTLEAGAAVFSAGNGTAALFPELAQRANVRTCKLQMMRIAPQDWRLPGVVMSDLSLVRYAGFAAQPAAAPLLARLERERASCLERGVHVIVAQGEDGSLVVGDSHAYGETADAFSDAATEGLILDELRAIVHLADETVTQRWNGYYPVGDLPLLREAVGDRARVVAVTSGTGMSMAFALGEETIAELFG